MTEMTLQERSFRNMIEFHLPELRRIMKDGDQSVSIRALPKETRRVLLNNGIVKAQKSASRTWKITESAREYLASLSRTTPREALQSLQGTRRGQT